MLKTIYIPDDKLDTWEEILKDAGAEKRGAGFFLVEMYRRVKAATK